MKIKGWTFQFQFCKNVKIGTRDLEIRVRSVRFTPRGFAKEELRRNIGSLIENGYPAVRTFGYGEFGYPKGTRADSVRQALGA